VELNMTTLHVPETLTPDSLAHLRHALDTAPASSPVLILRGAPGRFCTGMGDITYPVTAAAAMPP